MVPSYRASLVLPPQQCVSFHVGLLLLAVPCVFAVWCGGSRKESVTSVVQTFLHAFCTKLN